MKKNINTIKNENEMTEERKTIRERVKEILESINEKAKKYWAGDDSTLRYMKDYRFLQKDMSREVTTKEFEEWLLDTKKKYDCKDSDSKAYTKSELMKDLDFEYYSMKRRAEEKKEEEKTKTKEKITVKKVSIANNVATCYAELEERVLMHDYCDVGVKDFWCKDTTRFRVDFELYDGGDTVVTRNVRVFGQLPYSCLCSGEYMTDCGKLDEHKNWTWYDTCYKKNLDYGKEVENYQIRYLDFVSHKVIEKMLKAIKQPKRYDKAYEYAWMVDFSK